MHQVQLAVAQMFDGVTRFLGKTYRCGAVSVAALIAGTLKRSRSGTGRRCSFGRVTSHSSVSMPRTISVGNRH